MYLNVSNPSGNSSGIDFNNEDQLYQLAQQAGGSVAESANELAHPNTGILSTIGNGFKNMFTEFINLISIPSEIIAGAISKDVTIGEAVDQHLSIDRAIFGDTPIFGNEGSQTTMQKVGGFIVRAPFDILMDPVTYLSFGAGNLSKVKVATQAAKDAEITVGREIAQAGLEGAEAARYTTQRMQELKNAAEASGEVFINSSNATLSKEGQDAASKYAQMIRNGQSQANLRQEARNLVAKSVDEFGKPTIDFEAAMKKLDDLDEKILKETIDAPLNMEHALETIGNLISRKPQLAESMLDRGGMKLFGRTILSGQRIESAIKMIPMAHQLEVYTSPMRTSIFGLSKEGKEYNKIERTMADVAKSRKNDAILGIVKTIKENKLTAAEAEFVTAAIEAGKMPIDPKLREIYLSSLGVSADEASKLLENDRVTNAVRQFQKMNAINYKTAIAAGISLSKRENYMYHLAELKNIAKGYTNVSLSSKLGSAKFAEVQKFTSIRDGGFQIGKAEMIAGGLEKFDPELANKALKQSLTDVENKFGIKIDDIQSQTVDIQEAIQKTFSKMAESKFVELIEKSIPGAKGSYIEAAAKMMRESVPNLDFKALKAARIEATSKAEKGIGEALRTSPELVKAQIAKIFNDMKTSQAELPGFTGDINEALTKEQFLLHGDIESIEKHLTTVGNDGVVTGEARQFIKDLKAKRAEYEKNIVSSHIDDKAMTDYMDKLVTEFNQNPVGVKHMLDSLIGKENKMNTLLEQLSEKRFAIMKQMDTNGELAFMDNALYRSKNGEIFRASRPTIVEANAAGFKFEQNALPIMVHASINTVKATVSKEFIDEVASKFGRLASEAPEGYREVNITGLKDAPANLSNWLTGKNGEPIMFHPEIAKRIEQFNKSVINDEDINAILEKFDKVTNIFKASVTSIFPAFHGRNAISNVLNSFLDIGYSALNPARHVMSAQIVKASYEVNALKTRIIKGDHAAQAELYKLLSRDAFTDKRGYTWSVGQIHQILKDRNIALGNQFAGRIDVDRHVSIDMLPQLSEQLFPTEKSLLRKGAKIPVDVIKNTFSGGQKVGQTIEDHSRIIHFLEHLDRTGDVALASERTKMFLFDYGDLSNFERTFLRRIIPFYTWMKKNVELQAHVLTHTPGRVAQEIHVFNTLSSVMSEGNGLTDEEYNNLPDYMKNQFMIVTSRTGEKIHVLTNVGSPIEAAFNTLQPKNILSAVNPFLRLPVELSTGYDVFREGMMSDTNNAKLLKDAPQSVKDLVGFVHYTYKDKEGKSHDMYSALNPKMFFFVMNQPFGSRIFQTIMKKRTQAEEGTWNSSATNLQDALGIASNDLDMEQLSAQAQKRRVAELQDLLSKAGIIYKINRPVKSKNSTIEEN